MEPKMLTAIPGPKGKALYERRKDAMPGCMPSVFETVVERAEGAIVEDVDGNRFIDFCGGIGVMNIGHSHPEVVAACKEQIEKIIHPQSYTLGGYTSLIEAAEALNRITPGAFEKRTAFFNSGAEAVENAVKISRAYTGRDIVLAFTNCFHGRTYLTANMNSKSKPYRYHQGHMAGGIFRLESPYKYRLPEGIPEDRWVQYYIDKAEQFFVENLEKSDVACIVLEPVQGEAGFIVFPNEFVNYLRKLCDDNGILLVADEVQTGFCRTGRMFGSDYWDVAPDIVCTSKSLAGGMPLSAVTARREIWDALHNGVVGGTLGGNAVSCAAAVKCIEIFERDDYAAKAMRGGEITMERMKQLEKKYRVVGDVRGRGAMLAMELVKDRATKEPDAATCAKILKEAQQNGLVVIGAGLRGNCIRFLMPLVITPSQINAGFDILDAAFAKVAY